MLAEPQAHINGAIPMLWESYGTQASFSLLHIGKIGLACGTACGGTDKVFIQHQPNMLYCFSVPFVYSGWSFYNLSRYV